jgi:dihydrofolate reductase
VLYQGFEQYWPTVARDPAAPSEMVDFAHWIEDSTKIVFSKSLTKANWKKSKIISVSSDADFINGVTVLKQHPGKDMVLFGGAQLAQTFIRLNLIDEYQLKFQPVVLGGGKPLFKDLKKRLHLKLTKSISFDSGIISLYYQPTK